MIAGIVLFAAGLIFLILNNQFSEGTSNYYYKLLKIRFNITLYRVGFILVGSIFFVAGFFIVLRIITVYP